MRITLAEQGQWQIVMSGREVRLEADCFADLVGRLSEFPFLEHRQPEVVVHLSKIRLQTHSLVKSTDRFCEVLLLLQGKPKVQEPVSEFTAPSYRVLTCPVESLPANRVGWRLGICAETCRP